jgi:hypothetical protein
MAERSSSLFLGVVEGFCKDGSNYVVQCSHTQLRLSGFFSVSQFLSDESRVDGKPWTSSQRRELFHRMHTWQMNCYLYAPKDDQKHRAAWRELYINEELSEAFRSTPVASF